MATKKKGIKGKKIPVIFHKDQLDHKPLYEWSFGEKISHPETTQRAQNILNEIQNPENSSMFEIHSPKKFAIGPIKSVHDHELITLYKSCMRFPPDKTYYPSVFPKRDLVNPDPTNIYHAGYYCFDSGTPLNATTWSAAAWSATCAYEGACYLRDGKSKFVYSLCRPPGHHASRGLFGGYCYFNNAAIAAHELVKHGKVVILDIDFHHGNGTQEIFYGTDQVYFMSIHGDPKEFYPFYLGFKEEKGFGIGRGYNLNIPLPVGTDIIKYVDVLNQVIIPKIKHFKPWALIISAGFDTYVSDPVGSFSLETEDYFTIGELLSKINLPTLIVQEGGYAESALGNNVVSFLKGFYKTMNGN